MTRLYDSLVLPIATLGLAVGLSAAPADSNLARGKAALSQLPLRFEENRGQFDPSVRYAARGGGYDLLFTSDGALLHFGSSKTVDISLRGANREALIEGVNPLRARTNYMVGPRANWHTDVANFAGVQYRQVYPGIDLIYYGSGNRLEYDFVLAPGADPAAIRMRFQGAGKLRVTPEGDLAYEGPDGVMVQRRPVIYQEDGAGRHEIAGRYVLASRDTVALRVNGYDRRRKLVIDPILSYSTYLGGTENDQITSVQLGPKGLLYMCGSTQTQDIPAINGAYNNNITGLTDIFLAIIDPSQQGNGQLVYFSYLGGSSIDIPLALAVDQNGVAYMTGTTNSTDFPIFGNSVQTLGPATVTQAFVAAIDPSQYGMVSLIYSTFLGGQTGANSGNAIALDSSGNMYIAGTTASSDFPVTDSAYAGVLYGPSDAFLTELSIYSSTIIYSSYLGGENDDDGRGVAIAANGQVYVAISTDSNQFPLAGPSYNSNNSGGYDVAIALFDVTQSGTSSLVYSTYIGGSSNDMVRGVALDPQGNLLITGYTLSRDFPVTSDAAQHAYGGNGDVFVAAVNAMTPAAFFRYSTFLGGSDGDVAYAVASDSSGNIYVTGYTLSADFPVTQNAPQPQWGQGIDIFLAKITPHVAGLGALQYSTYLGGATVNTALTLTVGPDGTAYAGGQTGGELPTSSNAAQGGFAGGRSDGFLFIVTN
jgi:Beta-propeller repeat